MPTLRAALNGQCKTIADRVAKVATPLRSLFAHFVARSLSVADLGYAKGVVIANDYVGGSFHGLVAVMKPWGADLSCGLADISYNYSFNIQKNY